MYKLKYIKKPTGSVRAGFIILFSGRNAYYYAHFMRKGRSVFLSLALFAMLLCELVYFVRIVLQSKNQ